MMSLQGKHEISVVMPVFNTPAEILKEAVESILTQTFEDFEFIIIDDCSDTKETIDYINSLADDRIRIIRNPENLGITKSLNIGFRIADSKYIARMDGDDISLPKRFEKQYAFMENQPDAILCGTKVRCFGDKNWTWSINTYDQDIYRIRLLFRNIGPCHPSVMYRRELMVKNNLLYDERFRYSQDYMMWVKASQIGSVHCIKEVLLMRRNHEDMVGEKNAGDQYKCDILIKLEQLKKLIEDADVQDAENHKKWYYVPELTDNSFKWFMKLIAANDQKGIYERKKFRSFVTNMIAEKVYATYDIHWKDPRSYPILLKYLPVSYVMSEVKKKAANKLGLNKKM